MELGTVESEGVFAEDLNQINDDDADVMNCMHAYVSMHLLNLERCERYC